MNKLQKLYTYLKAIPKDQWVNVFYHMCNAKDPGSMWPYSLGYELAMLIEADKANSQVGALEYINKLNIRS